MKWFWRYLARKIKRTQDEPEEDMVLTSNKATVRARDSFETDEGLNMQVFKAIGGRIVSFHHYDRKTDRTNRKVYIITDEQDFERELGKIITLESMRG